MRHYIEQGARVGLKACLIFGVLAAAIAVLVVAEDSESVLDQSSVHGNCMGSGRPCSNRSNAEQCCKGLVCYPNKTSSEVAGVCTNLTNNCNSENGNCSVNSDCCSGFGCSRFFDRNNTCQVCAVTGGNCVPTDGTCCNTNDLCLIFSNQTTDLSVTCTKKMGGESECSFLPGFYCPINQTCILDPVTGLFPTFQRVLNRNSKVIECSQGAMFDLGSCNSIL